MPSRPHDPGTEAISRGRIAALLEGNPGWWVEPRCLAVSRIGQQATAHEIANQSLWNAIRISQCDVSIVPNKVECPANKTTSSHLGPPFERMDWQTEFSSGVRQSAAYLSVNMNLPRQRSQGGEIILNAAPSRPKAGPHRVQ